MQVIPHSQTKLTEYYCHLSTNSSVVVDFRYLHAYSDVTIKKYTRTLKKKGTLNSVINCMTLFYFPKTKDNLN